MRQPKGTKDRNFQVSYDFTRPAYKNFRKALKKILPGCITAHTSTQSVIVANDNETAQKIFGLAVKCSPKKVTFDDCLTIYRFNIEASEEMEMPSMLKNPFKGDIHFQVGFDYLPNKYVNHKRDPERHRQRARFYYHLRKLLHGRVKDHSKSKSVLVISTFDKAIEIADYIVKAGGLRVTIDVCEIISRFPKAKNEICKVSITHKNCSYLQED